MEKTDIPPLSIVGCGAWSPWFENWDAFVAQVSADELEEHGLKAPAASVIPGTERRRAPLPVKLAIEASMQACAAASMDPTQLPSVFVSGLGDTQLTDYMCRTLASENKALSPTRFHNSVHNAAAGYWTISVGCMRSSNSLAGYEVSMSMALLEAAVQANSEQSPILITFYDAPVAPVLQPLLHNRHAFALALVVAPATAADAADDSKTRGTLRLSSGVGKSAWPELGLPAPLKECYETNPAARSLLLAELLIHKNKDKPVTVPLSNGTSMALEIS